MTMKRTMKIWHDLVFSYIPVFRGTHYTHDGWRSLSLLFFFSYFLVSYSSDLAGFLSWVSICARISILRALAGWLGRGCIFAVHPALEDSRHIDSVY